MTKILYITLIIVLLYIIGIFLAPNITSSLENTVGIGGTTNKIRNFKESFDEIVTDIPSVSEFKSGAIDIGAKVKEGLETTKEKIDDVREGVEGAKETLNSTIETIDNVTEKVKAVKDSAEGLMELGESIKGTVNIQTVGDAIDNE